MKIWFILELAEESKAYYQIVAIAVFHHLFWGNGRAGKLPLSETPWILTEHTQTPLHYLTRSGFYTQVHKNLSFALLKLPQA